MGIVTAIAFDPGRTTGYALGCKDETGYFVSYCEAVLDHLQLWKFIPSVDHVICEDFKLRKMGVDLYPLELIGVIKLWNQLVNRKPVMQQPWVQGDKDAYFSDKKLKDMGLYQATPEHGRSAVKHLLYWFQFEGGFKYDIPGQKPELVEETWIRRKMGINALVLP